MSVTLEIPAVPLGRNDRAFLEAFLSASRHERSCLCLQCWKGTARYPVVLQIPRGIWGSAMALITLLGQPDYLAFLSLLWAGLTLQPSVTEAQTQFWFYFSYSTWTHRFISIHCTVLKTHQGSGWPQNASLPLKSRRTADRLWEDTGWDVALM